MFTNTNMKWWVPWCSKGPSPCDTVNPQQQIQADHSISTGEQDPLTGDGLAGWVSSRGAEILTAFYNKGLAIDGYGRGWVVWSRFMGCGQVKGGSDSNELVPPHGRGLKAIP